MNSWPIDMRPSTSFQFGPICLPLVSVSEHHHSPEDGISHLFRQELEQRFCLGEELSEWPFVPHERGEGERAHGL